MKNKFMLNLLIVVVMVMLMGCQNDTPAQGLTSEVAEFISENKLNYDEEGNHLGYEVYRDDGKNKIIVNIGVVTDELKAALKEEFGDLVKVVESDVKAVPVVGE